MRTALLALVIIALGLFAAVAVVDRRVELPPVGRGVEQICAETMQRTSPDLSWVTQDREAKVRGREIKTVTLGEVPSHSGSLVRVAECCTRNSNGLGSTRHAPQWRTSRGVHHGSRSVRSG